LNFIILIVFIFTSDHSIWWATANINQTPDTKEIKHYDYSITVICFKMYLHNMCGHTKQNSRNWLQIKNKMDT